MSTLLVLPLYRVIILIQLIPIEELSDISIRTVDTDFKSEAWKKKFLALESKRYRFASLYDPLLAMNASKVDSSTSN